MIDLDEILQRWAGSQPWESPLPNWAEASAEEVARQVAAAFDMNTDWDPPDEEWVRLLSARSDKAMVSTLFPWP